MSNLQTALFLLLVFAFVLGSCHHRFSCDASDDKKLGSIEFSPLFQQYVIENKTNTITFTNAENSLTFTKKSQTDPIPYRLKEYNICESINVKPYVAYAFYEYKNLSSVFLSDEMLIEINPQIEKKDGENTELIYLNIARNETFKASIPIGNQKTGPPFGDNKERFELKEQVEINGKVFHQVWVGQSTSKGIGIFYTNAQGIIAIEIEGRQYLRVN